MTSHPLLIIGASGHANALLSLLSRLRTYDPIGFVDSFQSPNREAYGLPILGGEEDISLLCNLHDVNHLLVAIGDNAIRQSVSERLKNRLPNAEFPVLVDPTAVVAPDVHLASGVVIMPLAHVGPGCVLEQGALINTQSSLDHDSHLGAFASLAPGAITGGSVQIGARSFIGLGSHLIHKIHIGSDTVVGAGSLVRKHLPSSVVAYGVPARVVRKRQVYDSYL